MAKGSENIVETNREGDESKRKVLSSKDHQKQEGYFQPIVDYSKVNNVNKYKEAQQYLKANQKSFL